MLLLERTGNAYPDEADPAIRYRLPAALRPAAGPDGTPQVSLTRRPDGGLLHLRLAAQWPPFGPDDRPVLLEDARFRLILRTPASQETGEWRQTPVAGSVLVDRSVPLSRAEAAIARHLGERGEGVVDVEIDAGVRGMTRPYPWLVSVPSAALGPRIAALLGAAPATWDVVEAAFLGLAEDTFTWYPLQAGAMRPPLDAALRAIARGAAATLLTSTSAGWTVASSLPPRIDVNLQVTSTRTERVGLRWSFSDFLTAQPDPAVFLSDVSIPAPLEAATITIVNDVPLAADGVCGIAIDVRTGGPTGMLHHEFLPGQSATAKLRFVRETFEALQLQWGGRCTVMTANGPAVTPLDFRPCDQLIDVDAAALKLVPLRFAASPAVFDLASSIEIAIGARTIVLNAGAPEAWAVGRQPPATVTVTALGSAGERQVLPPMPFGPAGLVVTAAMLGAGEVADVTLRQADDLAQRVAYLAVQPEGRPWRTLSAGAEITVPVRLESRLKKPRVRYRTRHVARRPDGTTAPMVESTLREASGDVIAVSV